MFAVFECWPKELSHRHMELPWRSNGGWYPGPGRARCVIHQWPSHQQPAGSAPSCWGKNNQFAQKETGTHNRWSTFPTLDMNCCFLHCSPFDTEGETYCTLASAPFWWRWCSSTPTLSLARASYLKEDSEALWNSWTYLRASYNKTERWQSSDGTSCNFYT